jgi:hypothetical protein
MEIILVLVRGDNQKKGSLLIDIVLKVAVDDSFYYRADSEETETWDEYLYRCIFSLFPHFELPRRLV